MGLTRGSYEAYCLDQAVWYFGITIEGELEKAGQKPAKGQAGIIAARKRVMAKFLGEEEVKAYSDPAALFSSS